MDLGDLIEGTEAHRDSITARFASPSDEEVEPDPEETGDQGTETETEGQGSKARGLTEEALARLLDTASQAGPSSPLPPEEDLGGDPEQGSATDAGAGTRTPARRTESVAAQFERAIFDYRDAGSAPRGLHSARRRKAKGVGVFGETR